MQMDEDDVASVVKMKALRFKEHLRLGKSTRDDRIDIIAYLLMDIAREDGKLK
jgi:hypothetical protein